MTKKKRKLSKIGRILSDVLIVICLCVAGYSGWNLYKELHEYKVSEQTYTELAPQVVTTDEETNQQLYDFDTLSQMNSDFVGWIKMNDSTIDYPFVQGDDNAYYLKHLFDGQYNNAGCVFIDVNNNSDFSDKNTVLYGHNMKNGTMFADIEKFKDASYYESHKVINIYTQNQNYEVYPVAGMLTDGQDSYVRVSFTDDNDFIEYVNHFISNSTFTSETTVEPTDRIVMLSTCNYDIADGRYVLIGKLVPIEA